MRVLNALLCACPPAPAAPEVVAEEAPGASRADSCRLVLRERSLRWRMEGALVAGPQECAEALLADPQEWRAGLEGTRHKLAPSVGRQEHALELTAVPERAVRPATSEELCRCPLVQSERELIQQRTEALVGRLQVCTLLYSSVPSSADTDT